MDKTSTHSIPSKMSVTGQRLMPSRRALNFVRQFARAYSVQARVSFVAN
ncbi:MAG: hypothetical protein K2M68_00945 [Muribaculaceae bacterium]|nr:hypothetical protein [Muribaculaceae bacterium]